MARMTRTGTATYLYCVAHGKRAPSLTRAPRGLPGTTRLRALAAGDDLWLIVADAPLDRYGSAPVEARLRDLDWVAACATAHEAVVEHVARAATTIPLKLFTLFNDDARAVAHVHGAEARIRRVLQRVEGCRAPLYLQDKMWPGLKLYLPVLFLRFPFLPLHIQQEVLP